ncbi:hypothetical protein DdX_08980 [Ditylenchus destructor]|uniref:Secreted protein n=1 Tax=Ditylenchus destructor TaxID=166010 RepID=A0AAD4N1M9_9BILA|nr:hypothetical protein DdX_08980 [Ditylenchus destructor]
MVRSGNIKCVLLLELIILMHITDVGCQSLLGRFLTQNGHIIETDSPALYLVPYEQMMQSRRGSVIADNGIFSPRFKNKRETRSHPSAVVGKRLFVARIGKRAIMRARVG